MVFFKVHFLFRDFSIYMYETVFPALYMYSYRVYTPKNNCMLYKNYNEISGGILVNRVEREKRHVEDMKVSA